MNHRPFYFFALSCLLFLWYFLGQPKISQDPPLPPDPHSIMAIGESFASSGDWVVPGGVISINVEVWGGGGAAGGGGGVNKRCGGGGAGGQYAFKTIVVSAGTTYSYTIGNGGAPSGTGAGNVGDDTVFGSSLVVAKGGAGGQPPTTYTGGVGTTASGVGDTIYAGGSGVDGSSSSTVGGGGGGGAGSTGAGGIGVGTTAGTGTSLYGGDGGDGSTTNNATGSNASTTNYGGGGGGGCRNGAGGSGRQGFLRITYDGIAVSISLDTGGSLAFTTLALGTTKDTTSSGIDNTQIVRVDTGPADLEIRSTNFTEGSNTWFLNSGNGTTQVQWQFSKNAGVGWTTFVVADDLYGFEGNVSQGETRPVDFELTMPTSTDSYSQYSTTVTIQASAP